MFYVLACARDAKGLVLLLLSKIFRAKNRSEAEPVAARWRYGKCPLGICASKSNEKQNNAVPAPTGAQNLYWAK